MLRAVESLYDRGLCASALETALAFAPLEAWDGVEACCLACRVATYTGGNRLSSRLVVRAWRSDSRHPTSQLHYGLELLQRRGPLAAHRARQDWPEPCFTSDLQRAELAALGARVAAELRDFAVAEQRMDEAEGLAPGSVWIRLQRAFVLENQDRVEEALDAVIDAASRQPEPFHRAAAQCQARLLELLGRRDEAVALLGAAVRALECGPLAAQWHLVLSEQERWEESAAALERFEVLSPLLEPPGRRWLEGEKARVAHRLGRRGEAARRARALPDPFHQAFADRLEAPAPAVDRLQLDVPFIRQDFKTCAPATFAALGRFWNMPADHVALAEALCYDGTPHHLQRAWAEGHGWIARDFRVTWDAARSLLARGIPFAMTTVEPTSAHLQAVIGFDVTRGTLLLRDPGRPNAVEAITVPFLERYRAQGPRGTVFLPAGEAGRLGGLDLPDSGLYDDHYLLEAALARHDRAAAAAAADRLAANAPGHALSLQAQLDLATYDADSAAALAALDRLRGLHPDNAVFELRRLGFLAESSREARIGYLEQACAQAHPDPALLVELASARLTDARQLPAAEGLLARALRLRPLEPTAVRTLGDLRLEQGKPGEAAELYRFAANLDGFREAHFQVWFNACRRIRRTGEALNHLADRFRRFGARSEQPALTLAWAWCELDQPARAREVLTEAQRLRPDDGYLRLRAAVLHASLGSPADGLDLLEAARGHVREVDWLRGAAELAEARLDIPEALRLQRALLEREPLALDAHRGVARALSRLEGPAAALEHLRIAGARFPHHHGLRRLRVEWSREAGPAATADVARELVALSPSDAWARRELALALTRLGDTGAALAEASEALAIEPGASPSWAILGHVLRHARRPDEARGHFRRAIELGVDNVDAIASLLDLAENDPQRQEELAFVEREIVRQVVSGDSLLKFQELARPLLPPAALLRVLRQAHAERPDLWAAWSALVSQLDHVGDADGALALARQAVERFAHVPVAWLDLAGVHRTRHETDAEIEAARHAFEINPGWVRATMILTEALERAGRMDESRAVYERALRHTPRDPNLRAGFAHLVWRAGRTDEALAALEEALRLAPGYAWAWGLYQTVAGQAGRVSRVTAFVRALASDNPGEVRAWAMLARILAGPDTLDERLAATERALALAPHDTEAWDLRAEVLCEGERFNDAVAACHQGLSQASGDRVTLLGRLAWIEAQRGELPSAIVQMRALLAENAGYAWGWRQLAGWSLRHGDLPEAERAMLELRRLHPHDPASHRDLAIVLAERGHRPEAREALAEALRLDPTSEGVADRLFALQLEDGELDAAGETLRLMQAHHPGAGTLAHGIMLDLRRQDAAAATAALARLARLPDPDPWPFETALGAFLEARRAADAIPVLRQALLEPGSSPALAAAAIRLLLGSGRPWAAVRWFLRLTDPESQDRAAATLAGGLAEAGDPFRYRWALRRRREAFRRTDNAWGQAGFLLTRANRPRAVAAWLADWRERPGAQPWMLFNLCLMLRSLGRYAEATEVSRHVLARWGHRDGATDMSLFLALEDALEGRTDSAADHLGRVTARDDVPYDQLLLRLARTLVEVQQAPPAERRATFHALRAGLDPAFRPGTVFGAAPDIRRTFRRTGRRLASDGAGFRARMWFVWRLYWHWPLAVVGIPALFVVPGGPLVAGILILARRMFLSPPRNS